MSGIKQPLTGRNANSVKGAEAKSMMEGKRHNSTKTLVLENLLLTPRPVKREGTIQKCPLPNRLTVR